MKTILVAVTLLLTLSCSQQPELASVSTSTAAEATDKVTLSTDITMKFIETGNPNGEPILLLHGYTDTKRSFQNMVEELLAISSTYRIIVPDFRGHGESSMPDSSQCAQNPQPCFTPAVLAADMLALMDELKIAKATVVGHSMGSAVAQEIALQNPERVHKLVLIGTFVDGTASPAVQDFLIGQLIEGTWKSILEQQADFQWPEDAYFSTPADLGKEITDFLKEYWVVEAATDEAFLEAVHAETIRTKLGTWIGVIQALGKFDSRVALQQLTTPTLILWATQDSSFPEADQEQVKQTFQKAAKSTGTPVIYKTYGKLPLPESGYPGSDLGHNLQWGAPKEVAADIVAFIETGFPLTGTPYVNPENPKQVLVDETNTSTIAEW